MFFQVFSFARKMVQGFFSSNRKMLMSLSSLLFHLQNPVSDFWNSPIYLGKRSLCLWNQPHFLRFLIKAFYLLSKTNSKKPETRICRWKIPEDNNAKINISPNTPCTFLLFKACAFLQIFFPRKLKFRERQFFSMVNVWPFFTYQPIYFFNWTKEHRLKASNNRTLIHLLMNLFFFV